MTEKMQGIKQYFSPEQLEQQEKFTKLSLMMDYVRNAIPSSREADEAMELVKIFNIEFKKKQPELKRIDPDMKVELSDYPAGKVLNGLKYDPLTDESEHPFDTDDFAIEIFIEQLHDFLKKTSKDKKNQPK